VLGGVTPSIHYEGEKELPNRIPWNLTETFYAADAFVIIPFSRLFKVWSFIFLAAFVYNLIYIPFAIGLDFYMPKELIFIDILAVIITFFDSLLRPHLAVDKNLEVELKKTKLFKGYLKHCFAWDVLSSLPLDYILLLLDNSPASPYFRLLRLFKAYRVSEIVSIFQKNTSMNVVISRLL
jgi:potassium channel